MKLRIILTIALAITLDCCKSSSPTDSTPTSQTNVPPGWSDSLSFSGGNAIGAFASLGNDLFIYAQEGIYCSTDDGSTITPRDAGIYFNTQIGTLLVKDNYIFAYALATKTLMRSSDLGVTWAQTGANALPFYPIVYGNAIYAPSSTTNTVCRSTDDGDTWTFINAGIPSGYGYAIIEFGGKLYLNTGYPYPNWVSSSDQGTTWVPYSGPALAALSPGSMESSYACNVVTADGTTLIGRTNADEVPDTVALWGAPSGSDVFTPRMTGLGSVRAITSLVSSGNNIFAAGRKIFHSTDDGNTWTDITPTNPINGTYTVLGIADGVLFAGGSGNNGGVLVRRPLSDFN